jgi:hypothetical protein
LIGPTLKSEEPFLLTPVQGRTATQNHPADHGLKRKRRSYVPDPPNPRNVKQAVKCLALKQSECTGCLSMSRRRSGSARIENAKRTTTRTHPHRNYRRDNALHRGSIGPRSSDWINRPPDDCEYDALTLGFLRPLARRNGALEILLGVVQRIISRERPARKLDHPIRHSGDNRSDR